MRSRRLAIVATLILLIGVGVISGAMSWPTVSGLYRLYFPTQADWDTKVGWRLCTGAIASWPRQPAPTCRHLHMCANEAPLDPAETQKLADMVRQTPGCPEL